MFLLFTPEAIEKSDQLKQFLLTGSFNDQEETLDVQIEQTLTKTERILQVSKNKKNNFILLFL